MRYIGSPKEVLVSVKKYVLHIVEYDDMGMYTAFPVIVALYQGSTWKNPFGNDFLSLSFHPETSVVFQ